ncbi:YggS family pyridoxal phosphate-dependent enzyme [Shewanella litorisediminis]|uniref:Pyridoxal phosphate homeostasis protein n=1 Tax=Shewanella litorisediminis TaxID=1173586 RepID=A0ABX7G0G1_9GAMM|nr:YggS family pyridoxal phosphate-dependent enzyme [Shewanella litorisediminis]MCL2918183.1 YggS family pyridoxal phosphate-dependent enzyme [Shewanella litorisediminis]QRH00762.1 YggS family pyridoxal phosphate-dependent enzyme [Shewanella litorisediminis]
MTTIADRLSLAQQRIVQAAQISSRNPSEIKLLAVSKTKPASDILSAYSAGQRLFGENYVQEGVQKIAELKSQCPDIEWHFIGPLQSNKSRPVAEHFDWLHTLDREKLAIRLSEQRPAELSPLNVLIQVNISDEESKSGVKPSDIAALADAVCRLPRLRLRGLMAIPAPTDDQERAKSELASMQSLFKSLQQSHGTLGQIDTLSMGMSGDLELAIDNGSTLVRVGSAIFGERDYSR